MSNSFHDQILKDTTEHVVIKLTGKFDGTGQENNHTRIVANGLYGAIATNGYLVANNQGGAANTPLSYYGLSLHRLWYDCASTGDVELYWHADAPVPLMFLNGNGEYDGAGNWVTISNAARGNAGCVGDVLVITRGMVANDSYTLVAEFRKDNAHYQRGQFNDPAAFNYGSYSMKP
jgi:hypothetical protein